MEWLQLPHWLMIAGTLLVIAGLIGLVISRRHYAAGSTIGGLCSFAVLFALSLPPDFSFTDTSLPISSFRLTFLLLFFASSGLNGLKLSVDRHLNIAAALRDFDAYQAQFKAIWGELNS
jgi:ABC-type enterochelin transport system permease subunit